MDIRDGVMKNILQWCRDFKMGRTNVPDEEGTDKPSIQRKNQHTQEKLGYHKLCRGYRKCSAIGTKNMAYVATSVI